VGVFVAHAQDVRLSLTTARPAQAELGQGTIERSVNFKRYLPMPHPF
jgi:hypothetical protein